MTNLDIETFWAVVQHGTMTAAAAVNPITLFRFISFVFYS